MSGRPSFSESHQTVFLDPTGVGRPSATLLAPSTFNATSSVQRPLIVFASSRNVGVLTQAALWFGSAQALANAADAFVLPVSTKTGGFGANAWNGNLCCCWDAASGAFVDDAGYLSDIVQRVKDAGWPVDSKAVFGGGDSAGEGVLYRSACDHAATWTGIWGFAGAGGVTTGGAGTDPACTPSQPVHLLHAHGSADASAEPYTGTQAPNGGMTNACNSTIDTGDTMDQYLAFNGCSSLALTTAAWKDLDGAAGTPGNETDLYEGTSCPAQGSVTHWKVTNEGHTLTVPTASWLSELVIWMNTHHRP